MIEICFVRLFEPSSAVVPAAHGPLSVLLSNVLAHIPHRLAVRAVQANGGGEAVAPLGQIEDGVSLLVVVSAVHHFQAVPTEEAVGLIVNGYAKEVMNKLPMEFAVEAQRLLQITLENSVG